jgi:hypothetical protein
MVGVVPTCDMVKVMVEDSGGRTDISMGICDGTKNLSRDQDCCCQQPIRGLLYG